MPGEALGEACQIVKMPLSALRVGDKLAEGGMAEIHTAMHRSGQVVLRRLKPDLRFNFTMRKRFSHGVDVRRRCGEHPNIVQYRGEGGSLFSLPYEVIEFVPGKNLKAMIFGRHTAVCEQPLPILLQCAAAITHVHQTGFLHLDIKPENFFVTFEDGMPVVKLSDFDLCQPVANTAAPKGFGGSLLYVAPEFFERQEISISSDIFAFGVMAYNLYTNQTPFIGSVRSLIQSGNYEIRFPAGCESTIPERLREIIVKCLSQYPKMRYRTGGELYSALEKSRRELAHAARRGPFS